MLSKFRRIIVFFSIISDGFKNVPKGSEFLFVRWCRIFYKFQIEDSLFSLDLSNPRVIQGCFILYSLFCLDCKRGNAIS